MIPSEAIGATSVDAAIAVRRPALVQIERWVARVVGAFAVAALLADIAILLIGVIARFGFNRPLVWSDELASIVFLWLAMLGVGSRPMDWRAHASHYDCGATAVAVAHVGRDTRHAGAVALRRTPHEPGV